MVPEIKPEADKLISFAKSVTGTSYLWGGTSTKMADCSGFVKTVYFTGGIILQEMHRNSSFMEMKLIFHPPLML